MSYSLVQPQVANRGQTGGQYFQIGRVKSVVLGPFKGNSREVDPDYGSPSDIGKIRYELIYSALATSKSDQVSEPAFPLFSFLKQYPIVNEIVFIIAGPTERQNDRISNQQFFYLPHYDVWNSANHGAFPNMSEYAQYLNQFANQPGYSGNATSGSLPLGYTFQEKKDVKNLRPFEGDVIMQARFGQSIRFGSTVPVMKDFNTWSNSGTNGSPITIISNSQGRRPGLTKFDPMVEDINQDGSAIWMTSDQQINLVDINSFPLSSFGTGISTITQNVVKLQQLPISNEVVSAQTQDETIAESNEPPSSEISNLNRDIATVTRSNSNTVQAVVTNPISNISTGTITVPASNQNTINTNRSNASNQRYTALGNKFEMFGSYRVDIRVIDNETGNIMTSVGTDSTVSMLDAYNNSINKLNAYKINSGISFEIPPLNYLQQN